MATESVVLRFPKRMKRGAKVRRGPIAPLVQFPVSMVGAALVRKWAYLSTNHRDWTVESADGALDPKDQELVYAFAKGCIAAGYIGGRHIGDCSFEEWARPEVQRLEAKVKQRARVKAWLSSMGIDWKKNRTAEDALVFLFSRFGPDAATPDSGTS